MASWLIYQGVSAVQTSFDSLRQNESETVLPSDQSGKNGSISEPQRESPSKQSPIKQLPQLYPIFPEDGSKGDTFVDIIAVHGIETTSPRTWIEHERDTEPRGRAYNWLKDADMLPSVVKGARIWVFDYNSNYSHDAQIVRIDGIAQRLLDLIEMRRKDFESRKIIFVGSCFGGIVIADALVTASREIERKRKIFDQTAGVIFLGSPLRGTKAANYAVWKNLIWGSLDLNQEPSSTLLDDLVKDSSRLEKLLADFGKLTIRNRLQEGIEIRCFYETRKTQLLHAVSRRSPIQPPEVLLVDRFSACLDCHEHIPLEVRHAKMNKYRGPEDPNFKFVSGRIKDVVDKIHATQSLTHQEQKCMQALSFPYQTQKDVNPERVKGTCEWFLHHDKFLEWRQESTAKLLWVTAGPGCGKSVLSKALVDEGLLQSENPDTKTTSICYFFFKDDVERGNAVNALRSVLHQLFKQKPWLIRHAMADYEMHGQKLSLETLWDILIKVSGDINAGPMICVFDALDECDSVTRKPFIQFISHFQRISNTATSKLKFLVTSRPYHQIEMDFDVEDLPSIRLEGNEKSKEIGLEVDLVITNEISRISKRRGLGDKTRESLIENLKGRSNRTYLWVYLMLKEIEMSLESTERELKHLLNSIPESVDDVYERILQRATKPEQARRVLHLILAAERPLTCKEMNVALLILNMRERGEKFDSERDLELDKEDAFQRKIENYCGLFVSIFDHKIYLIHQTAKEYLTKSGSDQKTWNPSQWKHTFSLEDSHLDASKACQGYLQLNFSSGQSDSKQPDFFSYASTNWTFHFREAGEKPDALLRETALQLCDTESQVFDSWSLEYHFRRYFPLQNSNPNVWTVVCYFGLATVVRLLIKDNSRVTIDSIDLRDKRNWRTPLSWAVEEGHEAVVKQLLELVETGQVDADSKDIGWKTPLSLAAWNGHEAIVKRLLELTESGKVDADSRDQDGRTPLSWAVEEGHEAVVKQLLELVETGQVDADSKDMRGITPLSMAAATGHESVFKQLLELVETGQVDADSKDRSGKTPLSSAAQNGNEAVVKQLLALVETGKVDADSKDQDGRTPLSLAAEYGYEAIAKQLLELVETGQVDADSKDMYGQTPLSWAAREGHESVVKQLLELVETGKVDADLSDMSGQTPLSLAARNGREAVVKQLLPLVETGKVDPDTRDILGHTSLWWANRKGHKAIAKQLQAVSVAESS